MTKVTLEVGGRALRASGLYRKHVKRLIRWLASTLGEAVYLTTVTVQSPHEAQTLR